MVQGRDNSDWRDGGRKWKLVVERFWICIGSRFYRTCSELEVENMKERI